MTRRQVLGRRRWCERCGGQDALQVHHRTYERLGAELDEDFEVLCRRCHATEHGKPYDDVPARPRRSSWWAGIEVDQYPTYSADYE
jgi:5-methylcytosine-specific restriction endonuclease McrA